MKQYLLLFVVFLSSCNIFQDSPDRIFNLIALNANKIPSSFQRHFKEIRQHKANGSLQVPAKDNKSYRPATCTEYVDYAYSKTFDKDIEDVKKIRTTDETKPIVERALVMFKYADTIYKKDFPVIAKMIDEGKSDEEIDQALYNLDDTKGVELDKMYESTMELVLPFAKKHGVEYKTINM